MVLDYSNSWSSGNREIVIAYFPWSMLDAVFPVFVEGGSRTTPNRLPSCFFIADLYSLVEYSVFENRPLSLPFKEVVCGAHPD
jgi:hypothetical protein